MSPREKPRGPSAEKPEDDPGWAFGQEADYARDGTSRWEIIAALAVVGVWVVLGFRNGGIGIAIKVVASYIIPIAMIWKPDVLGRVGAKVHPLWRMDHPTPQRIVRVCGWLWLFFPLLVNGFAMLFRSQLK